MRFLAAMLECDFRAGGYVTNVLLAAFVSDPCSVYQTVTSYNFPF